MADALLVLEDGTSFRGEAFGGRGTTFGEVVFNTGMTGYQEVLTDPSYHRQIVVMTSAQQGNYGVNDDDPESARVQVAGFVVREVSRSYSNWRARRGLDEELCDSGVVGIAEVDTRRLTRHIRSAGAMRGAISTDVLDEDLLLERVRQSPQMEGSDLTAAVTTREAYEIRPDGARYDVVAVDFGLKQNILRLLVAAGCRVRVVPATTPAGEVLADRPDGVFLSNGPGDPAAVRHGVAAVREIVDSGTPTFGICLGHQLLGLAAGAGTYKLPFGHHGSNHPVRNLERGTIEIATHNHGFALDRATLPAGITQTHVNLNDGTNAGIRLVGRPAFSVQYHPEAGPGPHDSRYLFAQFTDLMKAT